MPRRATLRSRIAAICALMILACAWTGGPDALGASGWRLQATLNPARAVDSELYGVSCPSANTCTAVGFSSTDYSDYVTLAERWNGTKWTIQHTPNPNGATSSQLRAVSCTSASACTAVGVSASGPLVERWNGRNWTMQQAPHPKGAGHSELDGVSCTSASACIAVGVSGNDPVYVPLAERWNGTKWTILSSPSPKGTSDAELHAVSCPSAHACIAVGYSFWSSGSRTLVEHWNGTKWTIQLSRNPSTSSNSLFGVSCSAATACTAVGNFANDSNDSTLAERWNGTRWTVQPTPSSGANHSELDGVSCTSATACTAVGYDYSTTLAEHWNGTTWKIQTTPNPKASQQSIMRAVSCISARVCTAVGNLRIGSAYPTLAERRS